MSLQVGRKGEQLRRSLRGCADCSLQFPTRHCHYCQTATTLIDCALSFHCGRCAGVGHWSSSGVSQPWCGPCRDMSCLGQAVDSVFKRHIRLHHCCAPGMRIIKLNRGHIRKRDELAAIPPANADAASLQQLGFQDSKWTAVGFVSLADRAVRVVVRTAGCRVGRTSICANAHHCSRPSGHTTFVIRVELTVRRVSFMAAEGEADRMMRAQLVTVAEQRLDVFGFREAELSEIRKSRQEAEHREDVAARNCAKRVAEMADELARQAIETEMQSLDDEEAELAQINLLRMEVSRQEVRDVIRNVPFEGWGGGWLTRFVGRRREVATLDSRDQCRPRVTTPLNAYVLTRTLLVAWLELGAGGGETAERRAGAQKGRGTVRWRGVRERAQCCGTSSRNG